MVCVLCVVSSVVAGGGHDISLAIDFREARRCVCLVLSSKVCSPPTIGGSPGEFSEELVTYEKRKKGWRLNCDVGQAT